MLAENAFCHEIAAQGHSRSFSLQSFAGRQGVAYRHILLLAVSVKFSKTQPPKSPKIAVIDNRQCGLTPVPKGTPANICMNLIFPETRIIGLHFLSLIVWVYLHSNLSSGLQKTHLFCDRVRFGRSRSFKVIQGQ